ncbi:hypothetical protein L227DRAFT_568504 [Lentinus tigrinus ALCF2SS1-6]|uniref:Granulins domain-containing protein n=1 Tax=Lentinus tigrinus ALCF2SS1-6 TaxID=1328759 RepID=A0A5C2RLU4_9APHY|nr:hypothetical protein L227DRAFT_568504 [Lentinus tigrinus ALCF2SS1-6]
MVLSTFVASLLASLLISQAAEAATLTGLLKAPGHLAKGSARRDTGWGDRAVDLESRDDGCPFGWAECSYFTCYPLDGSVCCSDGNFCDPGYYCDGGGCCLLGHLCSGSAPPASTIEFTTTSTRRFTSTTVRTTSTSFDTFSTTTTARDTSTFITFTPPSQSTEFGTVTDLTSLPTGTGGQTGTTQSSATSEGSNPTGLGSLGSGNGAAPTVPRDVHTGMWVALLLAVVMCLA